MSRLATGSAADIHREIGLGLVAEGHGDQAGDAHGAEKAGPGGLASAFPGLAQPKIKAQMPQSRQEGVKQRSDQAKGFVE